jgi:DNA-binding response OmpR family regulator
MSRTVLLVEDEPDIMFAARVMLEAAGFAVVEASGGEVALELVYKQKPDAILLDLRMPGLDGWGVLEALRAAGASSRWPVIILTAHGSPSTIERTVELGAKGYVKKPFQAADLTRALETVLG